jgi:sigma-B regulation protein RsbU (phosphoserine phosphatase)
MADMESIGAVWRALTRIDRALLVTLALTLVGGFLIQAPSLSALARLISYVVGFWLGIRLLRRLMRRILWRLRNRLLVAYTFIALVPIVLIGTLALLVLYAMVGQIAIYMMTSELERRSALLVSTAIWIAERAPDDRVPAIGRAYPVLASRLPELAFHLTGGQEWKYPPEADAQAPPEEWGDAGGLVIRDNQLYIWAHIVREGARVTAMAPLTSRLISSLAPNIGEFSFLRFEQDSLQPRRVRLRSSAGSPDDVDAPRNRLPEPHNRFDLVVQWATLFPVYLWDRPGRTENEYLRVRTRPIAVMNLVFAQKVDFAQGVIPALLITVSILFLLAELAAMIVGVSITRTITSAVHDLYEGTERVKEGDFSHRIPIQGDDQLARLGESFNTMTANVERLLVVAKENERLQADLEIAREVQTQLYPRSLPAAQTLRLTALSNPARMVSGDYYDCQMAGQGMLALAMGDVAGKGISAALLMATLQSALRTQLRHCLDNAGNNGPAISTSNLVSQLNLHLHAQTAPEKYATFCFCLYNDKTGVLTYTNAGHLPPVLLRRGSIQPFEVNGTVVGAFPFSRYEESQVRMEPGDLLLFYTDGVTEPENEYGEQFGQERLFDLLRRHQSSTPEKILDAVAESVREWTGSEELQDDMTMLLARRI